MGGSYEAPIHRQVFNEILLTDRAGTSGVDIRKAGRILISGVKAYIDDGTDLNLISSA